MLHMLISVARIRCMTACTCKHVTRTVVPHVWVWVRVCVYIYIYTHIICIYIYTHTCMSATSLQELGLRHLSTYEHVLKTTRVPSNEARKNTCAIYPKTVHA